MTDADPTLPVVSRVLTLRRDIPPGMEAKLRHQPAYNRFVSDWIVAVGDPRASIQWNWQGATSESQGCTSCIRPARLAGKGEAQGVYELWTPGRFLDVSLLDASQSEIPQIAGIRVPVTQADLVLPKNSHAPAQTPPIAAGSLQGTIYLHSGEVMTGTVDLVAGGRAGWDVVVDRAWRSHLIGRGVLGHGWSSSLFRRLRALPTGEVEYRDGSGNIWTFTAPASSQEPYGSPAGLFLQLFRTDRGWEIYDQLGRVVRFDVFGRLASEADLFHDPTKPETGNVIHYLYDRRSRLVRIVDPVNRMTQLDYWPDGSGAKTGLLWKITDWRGRQVEYDYDGLARLVEVRLPEVTTAEGVPSEYAHTGANRPRIRYTYQDASGTYRHTLEMASNLVAITDPSEVASGGPARVEWSYANALAIRDRVETETWPCGSFAGSCSPDRNVHVERRDAFVHRRPGTGAHLHARHGLRWPHASRFDEGGSSSDNCSRCALDGGSRPGCPERNTRDGLRGVQRAWAAGIDQVAIGPASQERMGKSAREVRNSSRGVDTGSLGRQDDRHRDGL